MPFPEPRPTPGGENMAMTAPIWGTSYHWIWVTCIDWVTLVFLKCGWLKKMDYTWPTKFSVFVCVCVFHFSIRLDSSHSISAVSCLCAWCNSPWGLVVLCWIWLCQWGTPKPHGWSSFFSWKLLFGSIWSFTKLGVLQEPACWFIFLKLLQSFPLCCLVSAF